MTTIKDELYYQKYVLNNVIWIKLSSVLFLVVTNINQFYGSLILNFFVKYYFEKYYLEKLFLKCK